MCPMSFEYKEAAWADYNILSEFKGKIDKIYRHTGKAALGCQTTWILIQVQLSLAWPWASLLASCPNFLRPLVGIIIVLTSWS